MRLAALIGEGIIEEEDAGELIPVVGAVIENNSIQLYGGIKGYGFIAADMNYKINTKTPNKEVENLMIPDNIESEKWKVITDSILKIYFNAENHTATRYMATKLHNSLTNFFEWEFLLEKKEDYYQIYSSRIDQQKKDFLNIIIKIDESEEFSIKVSSTKPISKEGREKYEHYINTVLSINSYQNPYNSKIENTEEGYTIITYTTINEIIWNENFINDYEDIIETIIPLMISCFTE